MEGFLIILQANSKREIVDLNHKLFGRIVNTGRGRYYYGGDLENTRYSKIIRGCYFVEDFDNPLDDRIRVVRANLALNPNTLETAREHWKKHISNNLLSVKNI